MKNNFIKILEVGFLFTMILYKQSLAETIYQNFNEERIYEKEDGSKVKVKFVSTNGGRPGYYIYKYNSNGEEITSGWTNFEYAVNGVSGYIGHNPVINFDENGNFIGTLKSGVFNETHPETTKSGKLVIYDDANKIVGVYNDLFDYIAEIPVGRNTLKTSLTDKDGNYYERDSHGNVTNIYHNDGRVELGKYNYAYDGAGNLTAVYENGIATYKRTSYTPAEAAAAANRGNKNSITFTFK